MAPPPFRMPPPYPDTTALRPRGTTGFAPNGTTRHLAHGRRAGRMPSSVWGFRVAVRLSQPELRQAASQTSLPRPRRVKAELELIPARVAARVATDSVAVIYRARPVWSPDASRVTPGWAVRAGPTIATA
eukprot:scaffold6452_cov129-Isochrysis_galbana.AAC.2